MIVKNLLKYLKREKFNEWIQKDSFMLIYLENFKKNTFVEVNKGFPTCTMRMSKIGEEGTIRTYTNQNMASFWKLCYLGNMAITTILRVPSLWLVSLKSQ